MFCIKMPASVREAKKIIGSYLIELAQSDQMPDGKLVDSLLIPRIGLLCGFKQFGNVILG